MQLYYNYRLYIIYQNENVIISDYLVLDFCMFNIYKINLCFKKIFWKWRRKKTEVEMNEKPVFTTTIYNNNKHISREKNYVKDKSSICINT